MAKPVVADAFFAWELVDADSVVDVVRASLPLGGLDFDVDGSWLSDEKLRIRAVRKHDQRGFGLELRQRENGVWCIVLDWRAIADEPDLKYWRDKDPLDRLTDRTFADLATATLDALPGRLSDALAIEAATTPERPRPAIVAEEPGLPELIIDDDISAVFAWPAFPAEELEATLEQWTRSREPPDDTWIKISEGDDNATWELACGVQSTGAYVVLTFTPSGDDDDDDDQDGADENETMEMVALDGAERTPRDAATLDLLPELFAVIASVRVGRR